jgi:hypothetical protein
MPSADHYVNLVMIQPVPGGDGVGEVTTVNKLSKSPRFAQAAGVLFLENRVNHDLNMNVEPESGNVCSTFCQVKN